MSAAPLQQINFKNLKTWRYVETIDAGVPANIYKRESYAVSNKLRDVWPGTALLLVALGTGNQNDTATIRIMGWPEKDNEADNATGIGLNLWQGDVRLGAGSIDTPPVRRDIQWPGGATWWPSSTTFRFSDAWTPASNLCQATAITNGEQSVLLFPTLGCVDLDLWVTALTGTTKFGILYRVISTDNVI